MWTTKTLRNMVEDVVAKMGNTLYSNPSNPFPGENAMPDFTLVQGQPLVLTVTISEVGTTTILFTKPDGTTETKTVEVTAVTEPGPVDGAVAL